MPSATPLRPEKRRRSGRYKTSFVTRGTVLRVRQLLLGQVVSYIYEDFLLHAVGREIGFLDQVERFLG